MNAKAVEGEIVTGELVLPEAEAGLLAELKKSGERIAVIENDWAELPDVYTKEGLALAKSRRSELVSMRTGGDENRLTITKPLRELTDSINGLWKKYVPRIQAVEKKYDDAIKKLEAEKEAARKERAEAKAERERQLQGKIDLIKMAPVRADSVEQIDAEIAELDRIAGDLFAEFDDYSDLAQIHIDEARTTLSDQRVKFVAREAERERMEQQRKELEEQQRKLDEANAEAERKRQEQEAEDKRIADERAKLEAEQAAEAERKAAEKQRQADVEANVKAQKKAAAAEKKRLAAMKPEIVQLRAFLKAVYAIDLPTAESPEAQEVLETFLAGLATVEGMLTALELKKAA